MTAQKELKNKNKTKQKTMLNKTLFINMRVCHDRYSRIFFDTKEISLNVWITIAETFLRIQGF